MSIAATSVFEVRTTGNDLNGGFFNSALGGTDYSQQDAPQLTLPDVVGNGLTLITSVTGGFTAAMVGNGISIAGQTLLYEIRAVTDANTATVDRAVPVGAPEGAAAQVGGALATPAQATKNAGNGNDVWVKAGTYSCSSTTVNIPGGRLNFLGGGDATTGRRFRLRGYNTTRGDKPGLGSRPVFRATVAFGGNALVNANNKTDVLVEYVSFDGNSNNADGIVTGNGRVRVRDCDAVNCRIGFTDAADATVMVRCYSLNHTLFGFSVLGRQIFCQAKTSAGGTIGFSGNATMSPFYCTSQGGGTGFSCGFGSPLFVGCTAVDATSSGFALNSNASSGVVTVVNCVAYNTVIGFLNTGTPSPAAGGDVVLINCAGGANSTADVQDVGTSTGFVTLTADPFVDRTNGNFGLNTTAGGGALVRGAGFGTLAAGLTTGFPDGGAAQHLDAGGGGGGSMLRSTIIQPEAA